MDVPSARRLDVLGLFCPVPILLAAREMQKLRPGDLLEVIGDDPGIHEDMPAWCEHAGHRLIEMVDEDEGRIRSLVEKGERRKLRPPGVSNPRRADADATFARMPLDQAAERHRNTTSKYAQGLRKNEACGWIDVSNVRA